MHVFMCVRVRTHARGHSCYMGHCLLTNFECVTIPSPCVISHDCADYTLDPFCQPLSFPSSFRMGTLILFSGWLGFFLGAFMIGLGGLNAHLPKQTAYHGVVCHPYFYILHQLFFLEFESPLQGNGKGMCRAKDHEDCTCPHVQTW